jgi:FkbM family methyltransferase
MDGGAARVVNDYSVLRVETRDATFHVRADDFYVRTALVRSGEYSPEEVRLLGSLLRPGDTAMDVGAHIGLITVPLARSVGPAGRVLAFEPQQKIFQLLCANLVANGIDNVFARCAAVGAETGRVVTEATDNGSGNLGERRVLPADTADWKTVSLITLDSLGLDDVTLVKIDVEGFELAVLDGASALLETRPMLYVENQFYLGPEQRAQSVALLHRLAGMDYQLWWHCPPLVEPSRSPMTSVFMDGGSVNVLAIPPRHAGRLSPGAARTYGLSPIDSADSIAMPRWLSLRAILNAALGSETSHWMQDRGALQPVIASVQFEATQAVRRRNPSAAPIDVDEAEVISRFLVELFGAMSWEPFRITARGPVPPALEAFLSERFAYAVESIEPLRGRSGTAVLQIEDMHAFTQVDPIEAFVVFEGGSYVIRLPRRC